MRKYSEDELRSMTTPTLHQVNEAYRSRSERADAGFRQAEASGGGIYQWIGWDCTPVAQPYHEDKRDRWAGHYTASRSALTARGESETEYDASQRYKDQLLGVKDFATKGGPIERTWKALKKRFL